MIKNQITRLPVKVAVDASVEQLLFSYELLLTYVHPNSMITFTITVEDMRPDLALWIAEGPGDIAASVLLTSSVSGRQISKSPSDIAKIEVDFLLDMLECMGWREARPAHERRLNHAEVAAARRIASHARNLAPADWPAWSTSEQIVAALANDRFDALPQLYTDAQDAWARLDANQREALRELNPNFTRTCG